MQLLPTPLRSFFWADNESPSAPEQAVSTPRQEQLAPRDWRLGFMSQENDCERPAPARPLAGGMPRDLNGTLYRNGPGRFDVYGERLSHWFDGDGKIAKIDIRDGVVNYQSRFVATARKA